MPVAAGRGRSRRHAQDGSEHDAASNKSEQHEKGEGDRLWARYGLRLVGMICIVAVRVGSTVI
jgi:hypothetical protein